ncbi:MAG: magnetochrome domain-containing protein [Alphaproteobacteria bacterium]
MRDATDLRHDVAVWIMALGIVFSLALVLTATLGTDLWEDRTYSVAPPIVAGMPAPHADGREKMTCSSCHIIVPPHAPRKAQPSPPAASINRRDFASLPKSVTVALAVPSTPSKETLERLAPNRFQGKIVRIVNHESLSSWQHVYVLVYDGLNRPAWVDLAPRWFLRAGGCHVRAGLYVKGTGLRDPGGGAIALTYGQRVVVNGAICTLRDHHGQTLWGGIEAADVE